MAKWSTGRSPLRGPTVSLTTTCTVTDSTFPVSNFLRGQGFIVTDAYALQGLCSRAHKCIPTATIQNVSSRHEGSIAFSVERVQQQVLIVGTVIFMLYTVCRCHSKSPIYVWVGAADAQAKSARPLKAELEAEVAPRGTCTLAATKTAPKTAF